ncbi:MAG: alpha-E domain-containing protein [Candidatus Competibacter sp.]|nr:alpha-E domain-containing protein [Candidatus Competibacter sp.]MDG4582892.1 alpha-E domain-containing protein [Candidatus Competibacter sp.]
MLSRVAQNIYWMARQIERAEDTARIINVNSNLLLDLPRNTTFGWLPLIFIVGAEKLFFEKDPNRLADETNVVKFLIGDRDHPSSIISSLAAARENLRTTRDTVPQEVWEQVNGLYIYARDHVPTRRGRFEFLRRVIHGAQQINGMLSGAMSRTAAYDFVRLGRYLERADMTTRILDVRSANLLPRAGQPAAGESRQEQDSAGTGQSQTATSERQEQDPFENIQWMSVLKSLSAYQMYRQQIRLRVGGPDVLKFLLQNEYFPRAVACCLTQMEICLRELPKSDVLLASTAALRQRLDAATVPELAHEGLHDFIDELQIGLGQLHDRIVTTYFA